MGRFGIVISSCRCARLEEALVPSFDEVSRRLQVGPARKDDPRTVERLEGVNQSWTVGLGKNVVADLDHIIGAETEEVTVEGGMMQRAESDSVPDEWLSGGLRVRNDMGRVEKLLVTQPAECALALVRLEYPFPESALMEPKAHDGGGVETTCGVGVLVNLIGRGNRPQAHMSCIVDGYSEGESARLICDDEDRPGGEVPPRDDPVKVDKRKALLHRKA